MSPGRGGEKNDMVLFGAAPVMWQCRARYCMRRADNVVSLRTNMRLRQPRPLAWVSRHMETSRLHQAEQIIPNHSQIVDKIEYCEKTVIQR